jgi:hypothetical protein
MTPFGAYSRFNDDLQAYNSYAVIQLIRDARTRARRAELPLAPGVSPGVEVKLKLEPLQGRQVCAAPTECKEES